jgi:hypothetical protein
LRLRCRRFFLTTVQPTPSLVSSSSSSQLFLSSMLSLCVVRLCWRRLFALQAALRLLYGLVSTFLATVLQLNVDLSLFARRSPWRRPSVNYATAKLRLKAMCATWRFLSFHWLLGQTLDRRRQRPSSPSSFSFSFVFFCLFSSAHVRCLRRRLCVSRDCGGRCLSKGETNGDASGNSTLVLSLFLLFFVGLFFFFSFGWIRGWT